MTIRANFVGTSFTVYDNGVNPSKGEALPGGSNCRQELAAVIYVSAECVYGASCGYKCRYHYVAWVYHYVVQIHCYAVLILFHLVFLGK